MFSNSSKTTELKNDSQELNAGSAVESLSLLSAHPGRQMTEVYGPYHVHFLSRTRRHRRRSGSLSSKCQCSGKRCT